MFTVPENEIYRRIERVQLALRENDTDALLIVQRVDLFYFSGTYQNGVLFIPVEGEPLLLIKKYYPRARSESTLKNIVQIQSIKEIQPLVSDFYGKPVEMIGLELDVMPVNYFHKIQKYIKVKEFIDGSSLILETRMIKSAWEIEQMEKTAALSDKTFGYMESAIRPGLSEMEFAGMIETFSRKLGHGGMLRIRDFLTEGYPWHVLSGKSGGMVGLLDAPVSGEGTSAAFPCGAGSKIMSANEPIMIDFGTVLNGYHLDETRMFAIDTMPDRALNACEAAIEIKHSILEKIRPGVTLDDLFQVSLSRAKALGYEDQYLGPPQNKVSFIGHGVGLELVEQPIIAKGRNQPLEAGMTLAIEPKMLFRNEFSAGIEDVILVTETGHRIISQVPEKVFIC
ncbi:MAG: Xaa-Pro peptidase family protein [Desulfatirhabdiaceae bacterium]